MKNIILATTHRFLRQYHKIKKQTYSLPLKLHLGCGMVYLNKWINIDINNNSVADIVCDYKKLYELYPYDSVSTIKMIHSLSYLRLWEAWEFFTMCFNLLKKDGVLILEFPDIVKCARVIIENERSDLAQYIEGIRGIYAFDLTEIKTHKKYVPYAFGWSTYHIEHELLKAGFSSIKASDPEEHNKRCWRDTRIEALK
jgi:hypothetical protein